MARFVTLYFIVSGWPKVLLESFGKGLRRRRLGLIRERTIFKQLMRADVQYVNEKTGRKRKGTRVSPCLVTIDFGLRVVAPHVLLPPFSVKRLTTTRRSRYTGLQRVRGWLGNPRESSTGDK